MSAKWSDDPAHEAVAAAGSSAVDVPAAVAVPAVAGSGLRADAEEFVPSPYIIFPDGRLVKFASLEMFREWETSETKNGEFDDDFNLEDAVDLANYYDGSNEYASDQDEQDQDEQDQEEQNYLAAMEALDEYYAQLSEYQRAIVIPTVDEVLEKYKTSDDNVAKIAAKYSASDDEVAKIAAKYQVSDEEFERIEAKFQNLYG